jgi:hypothetical protein
MLLPCYHGTSRGPQRASVGTYHGMCTRVPLWWCSRECHSTYHLVPLVPGGTIGMHGTRVPLVPCTYMCLMCTMVQTYHGTRVRTRVLRTYVRTYTCTYHGTFFGTYSSTIWYSSTVVPLVRYQWYTCTPVVHARVRTYNVMSQLHVYVLEYSSTVLEYQTVWYGIVVRTIPWYGTRVPWYQHQWYGSIPYHVQCTMVHTTRVQI